MRTLFSWRPGSSVGIATGYGPDGPGIESRWGARFSAPVQTGPGAYPTSCTMDTGSFPGGEERPGRDADPSPPSRAVGHERVELYLYSPYGPYGLYRASVHVQRCTLPFVWDRRPHQSMCSRPFDSCPISRSLKMTALFSFETLRAIYAASYP